jgi:transcriptional regulator with XRE-family HTH domain
MKFADIGQQLRAYRLESGMRAEEIAARLGVSRAALYRYEKGEVIKLETIRRLAELLKISPLSLLGIGVEYFSRPAAFGDRLRNLEEQADQILQIGGRLCQPLTTDALDGAIAEAWAEVAETAPDRTTALAAIEQALQTLAQRKRSYAARKPNMIAVLSEPALRRLLADGICGGVALPDRTRARCRIAALAEVSHIASLMEESPIGLQIGLVQGGEPAGSFRILRTRDRATVLTSPFPLDSIPWVSNGVAAITGADDAVAPYQRVAESLWRDALKGGQAAERLRTMVREADRLG